MNHYFLTGKQPKSPSNGKDVLSNGWRSTDLLMQAWQILERETPDRSFTFYETIDAVDGLMYQNGIEFIGEIGVDHKRYKSPGDRLVRSRFGDMLRSGIITDTPPTTRPQPEIQPEPIYSHGELF